MDLCLGKGLAIIKIPGLRIKTIFAVMGTSTDKYRYPDPQTIRHIILLYICIIHSILPFSVLRDLHAVELYVQNSGIDLFRLAHIPEILTKIATGSSGHIHFVVVSIATIGAFPYKIFIDHDLSIKTTFMTII